MEIERLESMRDRLRVLQKHIRNEIEFYLEAFPEKEKDIEFLKQRV